MLTVHDSAPVMLPAYYKRVVPDRVLRFDFAIVLPKLIENCDLTIGDSYSTMTDLIAKVGVRKEKLTVIDLRVGTSFFHPHSHYNQIMRKYNLRRTYLLYVGDGGKRKNLKTLSRAARAFFKRYLTIWCRLDRLTRTRYKLTLIQATFSVMSKRKR